MTREEAMTVIARFCSINTGSSGAGIELLIQIVQAGAAAEREACAKVCDAWSKRPDDVGGYCADAIRARGDGCRV